MTTDALNTANERLANGWKRHVAAFGVNPISTQR